MNKVYQEVSQPHDNIPLKRTRAKRSCDFCRKRKSRCDADTSTPCSNCRAWGYTCEFQTVRKKRGPPSVYVDNLEKKCKKMESLLSYLTKCSIKDLERNDFQYNGCVQQPYSSHNSNSDSSSEDESDDFDPNQQEAAVKDYDSIKYTGESSIGSKLFDSNIFKGQSSIPWPGRDNIVLKLMSQDELMIVRTEKSSLTGKSDMLLDVGLSMRAPLSNEQHNTMSSLSSSSLSSNQRNMKKPAKYQIDKMIGIYFSHLHTMLPIVHKPNFLEQYHNPSIASPPSILVQAILALSFRFASQHLPDLMQDANEFGDMYFRKVMKRLRDSARSRLCHVQAALLMSLYLDMDEGDVESIQWCTVGSAIRMAQDLGLHRSCTNWNIPRSEIETRHRVFYACYVMDRWLGARAGKPLTILDRDFDTDMPSPYEIVDDESHDHEHEHHEQKTARPCGPPVYRPFILLINLSEILGRVLKALYAPNAKKSNTNAGLDDPTILVVFEKRLQQWKKTMQEPFDGVYLSDLDKMNLQLFHYTLILLLHRPFNQLSIEQYPHLKNIVEESEKACTYAANKIFQIVHQRQYHTSDPAYYHALSFPSCYIYTLFQSSLVFLSNALRNKTPKNIQAFHQSIYLIKSNKDIEPAPRAIEILNMLAAVNGLTLNDQIKQDDSDLGLPTSPKTTPPLLSIDNTAQMNVSTYPKTQYIQHRMMNTSIIGGITPDIQSDVGIVMSRPTPCDHEHKELAYSNPQQQPPCYVQEYPMIPPPSTNSFSHHQRSFSMNEPSFTPHTTYENHMYTPQFHPSSLPQAPQAYTAAYDPNMNVSNSTLPPSSLNWSDWDVYIGQQHQM